jgi:hypothetical protein
MEIESIRNSNGQKDRQKRQMKRERERERERERKRRIEKIVFCQMGKNFNVCPLFFICNVDYIL